MRAFYTVLLISSCLFYGCLETDDFEVAEENPTTIILTNPIRFDQLAVGQKSTYVLTEAYDNQIPSSSCQQGLDTLQVEIMEQDTNGYLVKETTTLPNSTPFFFYLKHEIRKILKDTIENEPAIKEYYELQTIKTAAIAGANSDQWSALYNQLEARLYLETLPHKSIIPVELENICDLLFLPPMKNAPLPNEDRFHHSELGATKDHEYENNYYGDILIMNHDYNYFGDGVNFTYGYSLEAGLIFSGTFLGRSNSSEIWHLVSDN